MKIVLIDDNAIILQSLQSLLEGRGHEFVEFENPVEALAYAEENPGRVDMVICDLKMPEMDGLVFFSMLRKIDPAIRRILISAYQDFIPLAAAFNEGGIHSFLLKPLAQQALLQVVEKNRQESLIGRERHFNNQEVLNTPAKLEHSPLYYF